MILSIANLLTSLMRRVPPPDNIAIRSDSDLDSAESDVRRMATTVRLDPQVRAFVDRHASNMGMSIQDFISMTLRAVMFASEEPKVGELDLMISRFFDLFEAYDIKTADIPRLLPASTLSRADLEHRDRILNAMNNEFVAHIGMTFNVGLNWLYGTSEYCIDSSKVYRWYKSPGSFARALLRNKLGANVQNVSVLFVTNEQTNLSLLNAARMKGDEVAGVYITPVIATERIIDRVKFTTYEIWAAERWNYINCRYDLKVLMLLCQKARISVDGIGLPAEKYEMFSNNRMLPSVAFKRPRNTWPIDDVVWDNDQNLERDELHFIKERYLEAKLDVFSDALIQYYSVINKEQVLSGMELPILR